MNTLTKDNIEPMATAIAQKLTSDTLVAFLFVSIDKENGTSFFTQGDPFLVIGPTSVALDSVRETSQQVLANDTMSQVFRAAQERAMDEVLHDSSFDIPSRNSGAI